MNLIHVVVEDVTEQETLILKKSVAKRYIHHYANMMNKSLDEIGEALVDIGLEQIVRTMLKSGDAYTKITTEHKKTIKTEFESSEEAIEAVEDFVKQGYYRTIQYHNSESATYTLKKWKIEKIKDIETSIEVIDSVIIEYIQEHQENSKILLKAAI